MVRQVFGEYGKKRIRISNELFRLALDAKKKRGEEANSLKEDTSSQKKVEENT